MFSTKHPWKLSTIISVSLTSTAETFALHIPCNQTQYCSHMPARNPINKSVFIKNIVHKIKKKEKRDKVLRTEMIPHSPQNKWFAAVYFSASSVSLSTSSSLGFLWSEFSTMGETVKLWFLWIFFFFGGFPWNFSFLFMGVENKSWEKRQLFYVFDVSMPTKIGTLYFQTKVLCTIWNETKRCKRN